MALAPFMVITFLVCLVVAYLYMTIKCFAQKRYSSAANLIFFFKQKTAYEILA